MRPSSLVLLLLLGPTVLRAQLDGTLDPGFDPQMGANGEVHALVVQPDGRVIIGGAFTTYNNIPRVRIARLNADGSLDMSFDPGSGASGAPTFPDIYAIALQPDGKVLIGGLFTQYNGTARYGIARLDPDGSLDTTFDPGSGVDYWVERIVLLSDGRILIGGAFTAYNGIDRLRIARLHADGSLDMSFAPVGGPSNAIYDIKVLEDGRILIAGAFFSIDLVARNHIARLHADGSLDMSFDPQLGTGTTGYISDMVVQPDSAILISGTFTSYNGIARNYIARILPDGDLDTSFDPQEGASLPVLAIALQPDGKVIIGGEFYTYNGISRRFIARLLGDGGIDPDFDPGSGAYGRVMVVALLPDGKALIAGNFTSYGGVDRKRVARLYCSFTGITERERVDGLELFPNPVHISSPFFVHGSTPYCALELFGSDGTMVRHERGPGSLGIVQSPATPGTYTVRMVCASEVSTARLIVE